MPESTDPDPNTPDPDLLLPTAERLQKVLARYGIASRRRAEVLITEGRVHVNGQPAQLGQRVLVERDQIVVDGQSLAPKDKPRSLYLLLNKPLAAVTTCYDPWGRRTVLDVLPEPLAQQQGLHPVGRLDFNSTGALLLTNDGALTQQLTHPSHSIWKCYQVWVAGQPTAAVLRAWSLGVDLDGRRTRTAQVTVIDQQPDQTCLEIQLQEGRKRQIRRVAEQLGHPVISLHRLVIGPIALGDLPIGHWRHLTQHERIMLQTSSQD
ncbi:MAG: pseudouridine synthase [Cyanobacteria bacterium P01_H01_bin.121]